LDFPLPLPPHSVDHVIADIGKASVYNTDRIKTKRCTKCERPLAVAQIKDQRLRYFNSDFTKLLPSILLEKDNFILQ
jgi:hypothetical protein